MRLLPIVHAADTPQARAPRFVRHSGTAVVLERPHGDMPGLRPSIAVASAEVSALPRPGIRAVIAPGFDERFFSEAVGAGILPIILGGDAIETIGARLAANPDATITVDLEAQRIEVPGLETLPFETAPRVRRKLLNSLNDFDELLEYREAAATFRIEDSSRRPWLYDSVPEKE